MLTELPPVSQLSHVSGTLFSLLSPQGGGWCGTRQVLPVPSVLFAPESALRQHLLDFSPAMYVLSLCSSNLSFIFPVIAHCLCLVRVV